MALKLILACFVIACLITAEAARRPGFYYRRGRIPERQDVDSVEDYPVRRAPGRYWKVNFNFNADGVLAYISHIGMCGPIGSGF